MPNAPHIPRNPKHEQLVQQHLVREKQRAFEAQARLQYLSRVAGATAASLDALCMNDLDRVEVLTSLIGHVAARSGGTLAELVSATTKAFHEQSATLERLRSEGKAPPAPVVPPPEVPPTPDAS